MLTANRYISLPSRARGTAAIVKFALRLGDNESPPFPSAFSLALPFRGTLRLIVALVPEVFQDSTLHFTLHRRGKINKYTRGKEKSFVELTKSLE